MTAEIIQMNQNAATLRANLGLKSQQFAYTTTFDLEASDYPDLEVLTFDECEEDVVVHYGFTASKPHGEWEVIGLIERVEFVSAVTRKPVHVVVDLQKFKQVITAAEVRRLEDFYAEDIATALQAGEAHIDNYVRSN